MVNFVWSQKIQYGPHSRVMEFKLFIFQNLGPLTAATLPSFDSPSSETIKSDLAMGLFWRVLKIDPYKIFRWYVNWCPEWSGEGFRR